jgi:hypothetical protein
MASSGISSITLTADLDKTNDPHDNTHVAFTAQGLPAMVNFTLNTASGATLTMSDALTLLMLTVSSDNTILGMGDYRLFHAELHSIPAHWNVNWGGGNFLLEAKDASNTPQPMGRVAFFLSTADDDPTNMAKLDPFRQVGPMDTGAPILDGTTGSRINYSHFTQEIDKRYYNASGAPSVFSRLNQIYANGKVLMPGEDHFIVRQAGGKVDVASFQFTGFQKISANPTTKGGVFEFDAPAAGPHLLFGGFETGGQFTTLQIDNVPGFMKVDVNTDDHARYDASASAGTIDLYHGPLPVASDEDSATRLIMRNTPTFVHAGWNFNSSSKGGAFFHASNPFEVLLLNQTGSNRLIAAAGLQDLALGYQLKILSFDTIRSLCVIPTPFGCALEVPVGFNLLHAAAGVGNDATGFDNGTLHLGDIPPINPSMPDLHGFLAFYERRSGLVPLTPTGPAAGTKEYVPEITSLEKGFKGANASIDINLDPFNLGDTLYPINVVINVNVPSFNLAVDFWSNADTVKVFTIPVINFDIGFINHPDYADNSPIFLLPLGTPQIRFDHDAVIMFEGFGAFPHFDPFSGMMLASSLGHNVSDSSPLTDSSLVPAFDEAAKLWLAAGIDPARLAAALSGARIVITDLPGLHLGLTDPETHTIWIDQDAAGYGWFIDPTPGDNSEFTGTGPSPAQGKMDLLTVVTHEMGHLLGFDDVEDPDSVMAETLQPGVRLTPTIHRALMSGVLGPALVAEPALRVPGHPANDSLEALFLGLFQLPSAVLDEGSNGRPVALGQASWSSSGVLRPASLDALFDQSGRLAQGERLSDHLAPYQVFANLRRKPLDDAPLDSLWQTWEGTGLAWNV